MTIKETTRWIQSWGWNRLFNVLNSRPEDGRTIRRSVGSYNYCHKITNTVLTQFWKLFSIASQSVSQKVS